MGAIIKPPTHNKNNTERELFLNEENFKRK